MANQDRTTQAAPVAKKRGRPRLTPAEKEDRARIREEERKRIMALPPEERPAKKPHRGAPPPQVRYGFGETDEDKALISRLLWECLEAYEQKPVQNDDELAERLAQYYRRCANREIMPTIEEMFSFTGRGHAWCWDILRGNQRGFTDRTSEILIKAKAYMKDFDAKMVLTGRVNPIVYFFRAKNYYDMADKQEVVVTPNTQDEHIDANSIAERYLNAPGVVETSFEEDAEQE